MRSAESRSKSSWKKRPGRTLILGAVLALVSLAVVYGRESLWNGGFVQKFISYLEMSPEQRIPTMIATPQDYTVTARAEGVLVGLYSVPVLAPRVRSGPMRIAWLAPEGKVVARGETLVRFDETDAQLSLEQGQNRLATQSHRIENSTVRQTGEIRQLEMEQQSADLERSYSESQIRKDETIFSQWEIRESLMDADLAESRLDFLSSREGLQEELGESQLRELNVERTSVEAKIKLAREVLSSLSVKSTVPGVIVYHKIEFTPPEVGSTVWPGQAIMEISSADRFRAIVSIPEVEIGRIRVGSRAEVVLDSFPDKKISGQIESLSRVAKQLNRRDPRKYFECSVLVDVDPVVSMELKPGMDLKVSILVEHFVNSLVLPRSAVFADGSRTFVFVATGSAEYQERDVNIIASDHGFHVVKGLEEGMEVCLRHPLRGDEMALLDFSTPAGATRDSEFVIVE